MRVRTRHSFAAPFVLVVGCSSGGGTSPDRTRLPATPAAAATVDAAVDATPAVALVADATVDATGVEPPTRGKDAPPKVSPCGGVPDPGSPPCNPPAPVATEARIVSQKISDGALVLVVDRGVLAGVSIRWGAELIGREGKVIPTGAAVISDVGRDSCQIRFPSATKLPPPRTRVRLTPP